ncbi:hypothetical protein BO70DRAFT_379800 [Aspergillus heteromorphus CBS 117.55]|uniref:Zinc knuckle-domain-containing protein n=1 Tax=Aspergillus heteromorphus CBS 117.55 TaxID=1448321 RepID=A0A317W945_9EURO|nr:uncharacterized protein BO70DRAFT_379800 [Aspergillus heteromorphus CBS 117.55]PWY81827.1 hypothetical protein BO70DRAFT_379800 [Aspergillus heteromorphus CBS 117.55]
MNRYRNAPGLRGPTKATPSTLCQKCLKRGHYSYECTVTTQERPYMSRPSRTQQLQNPKLRPQLSADVLSEESRTTGLADEILAKKREGERGRKRDLDEVDPHDSRTQMSKRARSASSHSVSSVATISTSRSHSRSPARGGDYGARRSQERTRSVSPHPRKRRYSDSSSQYSDASHSSGERGPRSRSREWSDDRNTRRRHRESSPDERGRPRHLSRDGGRRDRTRSRSVDHSRIARARRSVTPSTLPESGHSGSREQHMDHPGPSHSRPTNFGRGGGRDQGRGPPPRKERSLSPYSKRIALTQSMNLGN